MTKKISEERQVAYYLGMVLIVVGFLLFASTFVTFLSNFGSFSNFESNAKSCGFRAFGGMGLIFLGGIIRTIGARGVAGSGVVLDPKKPGMNLNPTPAWPAEW